MVKCLHVINIKEQDMPREFNVVIEQDEDGYY